MLNQRNQNFYRYIANKQNVAPVVGSEQLFDEPDLPARDSDSSCEQSLTVSCDGVDSVCGACLECNFN